jgi:branched-subunit amino acid aminotransferase/4-amino-4-deoxychorismate lyase
MVVMMHIQAAMSMGCRILTSISGRRQVLAVSVIILDMDVYLNGRMVDPCKAQVSVEDAGFTHAVGLFETMAARNRRVFRMDRHLARINDSAQQLGLARSLDIDMLRSAIAQTLEHNKLTDARVRLSITAGQVSMLGPGDGAPQQTVLISATEPTQYDPAYFEQGIKVLIAPPGANPFDQLAGHKTLAYWGRLRTLRQAAAAGAGEAIWLNVTNHLASGAVSNIFIVKDGSLLTPYARGEEVEGALPAPVLPGITRAAVLEIAEQQNIPIQKRMLDVNDLLEADEVFLTNSSWHVLPVTSVEKKNIGDGQVGAMTSQLRQSLLETIERETQAGT